LKIIQDIGERRFQAEEKAMKDKKAKESGPIGGGKGSRDKCKGPRGNRGQTQKTLTTMALFCFS
jgi:hypothetical protein